MAELQPGSILERPREYQRLVETRELKKHLAEPVPSVMIKTIRLFAAGALVIGLAIILLIIYAVIFGHRFRASLRQNVWPGDRNITPH